MKRRNFFKNAALAGAGLGLVSLKANARNDKSTACTTAFFTTRQVISGETEFLTWDILFCTYAAKSLETAPSEDKILTLRLIHTKNEVKKIYEAKYDMQSAKAVADNTSAKTVTAVQTSVVKSEYTPTSALNLKKLVFRYNYSEALGKVELLDSKGNLLIKLSEYEEIYDDCFLTTACTVFMNKSDDCPELTELRKFRDTELVNNAEGRKLVDEYYAIAPQIVQNIARQSDKAKIFNAIYTDMIMPTLERIHSGDKLGAIDVYKNYTYKLKAEFGA